MLWPKVMFLAETSPAFMKELDTNKNFSTVIRKSLDIVKHCSTPQKQVHGTMETHKTFRNRNSKEEIKPVFFNQSQNFKQYSKLVSTYLSSASSDDSSS